MRDGEGIMNLRVTGARVVAAALLALSATVMLVGCQGGDGSTTSGGANEESSPETVQVSDAIAASTTTEVTISEDNRDGKGNATDVGDTGAKADAIAGMLPSVAQLPPGRTADEVKLAIAECIADAYPDAHVISAEIVGSGSMQSQQTVGVEDYWASYLIELSGYGKIGVMETCSSEMEPIAHEADFLPTKETEHYDVRAGAYVEDARPTYENDGDMGYWTPERLMTTNE